MVMDWTKDEAARLGFEDQARRGVGICDEELMAQLMEVDFGTTILSRLRPEQRIGLMRSLLLIVANCPVDIDMAHLRVHADDASRTELAHGPGLSTLRDPCGARSGRALGRGGA